MILCYTVFNKETETFSNLWTNYDEYYQIFFNNYKLDIDMFKNKQELELKKILL